MAGPRKSERERLNWAIGLLREWEEPYQWAEVENVFLHLDELDRSANAGLWAELRRVLTTNEAFRDPDLQRFLRNERLARKGHWWYDPNQWIPVGA